MGSDIALPDKYYEQILPNNNIKNQFIKIYKLGNNHIKRNEFLYYFI